MKSKSIFVVMALLAALLINFLAIATASAAESTAPASVLLEKGIFNEETRGDLAAAIGIYRQIIEDDKANRKYVAEAHYRLGLCLLKNNEPKQSLEAFKQVIENYSDQKELASQAADRLTEARKKFTDQQVTEIVTNAVKTISTCAETDPRVAPALASMAELEDQAVVREIAKFLDSDKDTIRRSAIFILWKGDFEAITEAVPGLQKLCKHEEGLTRGMAALALAARKVESSFQTICDMTLNDPDDYARRCAAYALGLMGRTDASDVLQKALKDKNQLVRNNAESALTMLNMQKDRAAPKVVTTNPLALANNVDPSLKKITVTFDQPMRGGSWAWVTGGMAFPETTGRPVYDDSRTTCTIPVKLEPGTVYWVGINSQNHKAFQNKARVPAVPYVILFATRSADGKPTPIPAGLQSEAKRAGPKQTYIVTFKPVAPFQPSTRKELLDAFNKKHPRGVRTHHFRTEEQGGVLIGRMQVDGEAGKEKIRKMLEESNELEFVSATTLEKQSNGGVQSPLNLLPAEVMTWIVEKHMEAYKQAQAKGLRVNTHVYGVDDEFNKYHGGFLTYTNKGPFAVTNEVHLGNFGKKRPDYELVDEQGTPQKFRIVEKNFNKIGRFALMWTPDRAIKPGELRLLGYLNKKTEKLLQIAGTANLRMNNHFGSPVLENFFLVVPNNMTVSDESRPHKLRQRIGMFDVYLYQREVPANTTNEVKVVLKSVGLGDFATELKDNWGLDLDTAKTLQFAKQWPDAYDVAWDNDLGGVLMIKPKSKVRIMALPEADDMKDAIRKVLAPDMQRLLGMSQERGVPAKRSRYMGVLTDKGQLAVIEIGNYSKGQALLVCAVGPPEALMRRIGSDQPQTEMDVLKAKLINWVEKFFSENYRDITARKTLEWGEPETLANGNLAIRYKYFATIWNKDKMVIEQRFTFSQTGKYISAETIERAPATQPIADKPGPEAPKEAITSAKEWLKLIDDGEYDESWQVASRLFKSRLTAKQWAELVKSARALLGTVKSRKLLSSKYTTSLPGVPDGQYVVIQYETSFEHKQKAVETITPMKGEDGKWRVSGYFIK